MNGVLDLSLMHGWLPLVVEIVAASALAGVVVGRRRRCGAVMLGVALVIGVVVTLVCRRALQSSGMSGEAAPWTVWAWTCATAFAAVVAVLGWRGRTGWWRNGAVFACSFCLLATGLLVNGWIGYFPTVDVAWGQLARQPLPRQIDWPLAEQMRSRREQPAQGRIVAVDTGDSASGFQHRTEWVYLPPAWFGGTHDALTAVLMIGGEFATTADWVRAGRAVNAADTYAEAHNGRAPVLVFADATGGFTNDTECVNGVRGRAADHLTRDVVPAVGGRFGIYGDRSHWSVAGFSSGGTCAVGLAVTHPELFGSFVDIAGDVGPNAGNRTQTVQRLFGGDWQAWAQFDPVTVMTRHEPYSATAGLFIVPTSSTADDAAAQRLCDVGGSRGVDCSITRLPGRHTWPFAADAFQTALPWLAGARGTDVS